MTVDCAKRKLQFKGSRKKSTWRSDETVDANGINTGKLHEMTGGRMTEEMRINSQSRMYRDFDDWYNKQLKGVLTKMKENDKNKTAARRKSMSDDDLEAQRQYINEHGRKSRSKLSKEGFTVSSRFLSNANGGYTEEVSKLPGVVNSLDEDTVSSLIEKFEKFIKTCPDGSVVYAFKGTAEEEKNPSQFLQDGNLNILKNEEFGWLLSPKRNNIIIQGSSGDQGETVPTSWVSDGTIEYDVVCYTQLNGSRLAYDL
eukprot:scaffold21127_cov20-Cyclotella_meneghiniana.AAC.1